MTSYYKQLVDELGETAAREKMRELRSKVKKPGFASMDKDRQKEIASKGGQESQKKRRENRSSRPSVQ